MSTAAVPVPVTPQKTRDGNGLARRIDWLNSNFNLRIPNLLYGSPATSRRDGDLGWRCSQGLKRLYFHRAVDLDALLAGFEEWVLSRSCDGAGQLPDSPPVSLPPAAAAAAGLPGHPRQRAARTGSAAATTTRQLRSRMIAEDNNPFGRTTGGGHAPTGEEGEERRVKYLMHLMKLIDDEIYLLNNGSFSQLAENVERSGGGTSTSGTSRNINHNGRNGGSRTSSSSPTKRQSRLDDYGITPTSPSKRRRSDDADEGGYSTAPSSPIKQPQFTSTSTSTQSTEFPCSGLDSFPWDLGPSLLVNGENKKSTTTGTCPSVKTVRAGGPASAWARTELQPVTVMRPPPAPPETAKLPSFPSMNTSFMSNTTTTSAPVNASFATTVSSTDTEITEPDSSLLIDDDSRLLAEVQDSIARSGPRTATTSLRQRLIDDLVNHGPFSVEQPFPRSVSLRYRYELERIGRAWGVPLRQMLVGDSIPFKCHEDFWDWIRNHRRRQDAPLPEKSTRRAWDAAVEHFKTDKHSEVVIMTGELDWCGAAERGVLKLKLNPLRIDRTCRFRRRFGSDRFLSLTIPASSRPTRHLTFEDEPSVLRESIAAWLTQNDHRCLGRVWKPFFVEQVKIKRKGVPMEPRFRVDFFAIDGVDFLYGMRDPLSVAPANEPSDKHTYMSLEALVDWHMPRQANSNQSNCKLFSRFSLGLSKTWATVVLQPYQIIHLRDEPGRPVMNDGCALMSRSLANAVCDSLGITGNTPSCFQARIAGAKGLWMVDKHESGVRPDDNGWWIQITDSQLKIHPHPATWKDPFDEEKLTFEVLNWSKPLHPVNLNIQLLAILEHGGSRKEYIAELTRAGIRNLYEEFAAVLEANSSLLCRALVQKLRPVTDDAPTLLANQVRRLEQWVTDDTECIIRFCEAGFSPREFPPLRKRLGKYLREALDRHVEELHIEVPLSTYAYCVADPYGVLKEDEVHFGFSSQWRDPRGQFEDNLLDNVDVLVGRLPAHLPSDIQRRRAVWKPELRHFKDVIVFSTQGNTPLAQMLSGGDYDGDTPWICWDPHIVDSFHNSSLGKSVDQMYPAERFGLTRYSVPMQQVSSTEEFLRGAFEFNLTLSSLGICTIEHEKIAYDESIDSDAAMEVACLLSHLVDGRKGGVHLTNQAWQQYRKTVSPRTRRAPAYKNPERKPKMSSIVDYLKYNVAQKEREAVLTQLEQRFSEKEIELDKDEDLVFLWRETHLLAKKEAQSGNPVLLRALSQVKVDFRECASSLWSGSFNSGNGMRSKKEFPATALAAIDKAQSMSPPAGDHPLLHMWQRSADEWRKLLASLAYFEHSASTFPFHAFGDTLCQIKASRAPCRLVRNEMLACYKVRRRMVLRLDAKEAAAKEIVTALDRDEVGHIDHEEDEFEGEEAIEEMLYAMNEPSGSYNPDDGLAVE